MKNKFKIFEDENGELEAVAKMKRPLATFMPVEGGGGLLSVYFDDEETFLSHPAPSTLLSLTPRGMIVIRDLLMNATGL